MEQTQTENIRLVIPAALTEKMDRVLITEEDARRTISYCENTGFKLLDDSTGELVGHLQEGALTYWVRYRYADDVYMLCNIYTHRVKIEEDIK